MRQLFIFNDSSHMKYDDRTSLYISQLTSSLKDNNLSLNVVNLKTENTEFELKTENDINYFFFPSFRYNAQQGVDIQYKYYYRNMLYVLDDYIDRDFLPVFHLNHYQYDVLASQLKEKYPESKIMMTVHNLSWTTNSDKNIGYFRTVIHKQEVTIHQEKIIQKYFQKEKEEFSVVDKIICTTPFTFNLLKEEYDIKPGQILFIPYGLPEKPVSLSVIDRQSIRKELFLLPDEKIILYLYNPVDNAGEVAMLQAFRKVLQEIPTCRLVVVGQNNTGNYNKETQGIWSKISFTGKIDKEQLYELYRISDLGILPYFHEVGCYTAIEMMSHGLPFLSTDCYGLQEIFASHEMKFLKIETKQENENVVIDPDCLKEKIVYILKEYPDMQLLGEIFKQEYRNHYALDRMYEKIQSFIRNNQI